MRSLSLPAGPDIFVKTSASQTRPAAACLDRLSSGGNNAQCGLLMMNQIGTREMLCWQSSR